MGVRFSVVMPVYNRELYLHQAIDSVLCQTFADYELIAVDDGSTDRSLEILRSYGNRIRVVAQKNSGPEVARNAGVAAASGEYIALLDSDDFFFPTTLEMYDRILRAFQSPPVIVGSQRYYRDGDPVPVQAVDPGPIEVYQFKDILAKTVSLTIMSSLYVVRRSAYEELGGFRNSTAQTWWGDIIDFVLRLGTHGPFVLVRQPHTAVYRVHGANSTKSLVAHAEGMIAIADEERQGRYPGGRERRWDRYALLGGICSQWAVSYCWRGGQKKEALRLLFRTAPMVAVAGWRKIARSFAGPPAVIVLPEEKTGLEPMISALHPERDAGGNPQPPAY